MRRLQFIEPIHYIMPPPNARSELDNWSVRSVKFCELKKKIFFGVEKCENLYGRANKRGWGWWCAGEKKSVVNGRKKCPDQCGVNWSERRGENLLPALLLNLWSESGWSELDGSNFSFFFAKSNPNFFYGWDLRLIRKEKIDLCSKFFWWLEIWAPQKKIKVTNDNFFWSNVLTWHFVRRFQNNFSKASKTSRNLEKFPGMVWKFFSKTRFAHIVLKHLDQKRSKNRKFSTDQRLIRRWLIPGGCISIKISFKKKSREATNTFFGPPPSRALVRKVRRRRGAPRMPSFSVRLLTAAFHDSC